MNADFIYDRTAILAAVIKERHGINRSTFNKNVSYLSFLFQIPHVERRHHMTSADRCMYCGLRAARRKENMWSGPHHNSQRFGKTLRCLATAFHNYRPPPTAPKQSITHFTLSSFCTFHAHQFSHSVSLCVYSYFDFSHPQTPNANTIPQEIPPSSFFRRYQSVYCNSNLMTSCVHVLTVLYVTRVTWWESGCSRGITYALVTGGLLHVKHLASVTVALYVRDVYTGYIGVYLPHM